METCYSWRALDEQTTLMTLCNRGEPKGFSRLLTSFMVGAMKRANTKDLAQLKKILEP